MNELYQKMEASAAGLIEVLNETDAGKIKVVMDDRTTGLPLYGVFVTCEPELIARLNATCEQYDADKEAEEAAALPQEGEG